MCAAAGLAAFTALGLTTAGTLLVFASLVGIGAALSAPAYEPTAKFPVRIDNGEIQVRDDRWD